MIFQTGDRIFRLHSDLPPGLAPVDDADRYATETVLLSCPEETEPRVLVLGDRFGALTVPLGPFRPDVAVETVSARRHVTSNLCRNGFESCKVVGYPKIPEDLYDLIVIRIPKDRGLWEVLLDHSRSRLAPGGRVLACGMTKHLFPGIFEELNRYFSDVQRPPARKKGRIFWARAPHETDGGSWPVSGYEEGGLRFDSLRGTYSGISGDPGGLFMASRMNRVPGKTRVIDLGCGNGLLGSIYKKRNPESHVLYTDVSFLAAESARRNAAENALAKPWSVKCQDLLEDEGSESADLILCNPPFHLGHWVTDHLAKRMIREARRVLVPGGELWLVGNRHLGYHRILKSQFRSVKAADSNAKFVIFQCVR